MYYLLLILSIFATSNLSAESIESTVYPISLLSQEIEDIAAQKESYAYFGPVVCSLVDDLPYIHTHIKRENTSGEHLTMLCHSIAQGKTTAPLSLLQPALEETVHYLNNHHVSLPDEECERLLSTITSYYRECSTGKFNISIAEPIDSDIITRSNDDTKKFCSLHVRKLCVGCLFVKHNATIAGDLTVEGNEMIDRNLLVNGDEIVEGDLFVLGTLTATVTGIVTGSFELIGIPQQACIIFVDETLTEKARICSSPIPGDQGLFVSVDSGATQNLRVLNGGGVTIAPPTGGETGLTINGGGETINAGDLNVVTGNIILPQANAGGTQGLLQLGGTDGTTNVSVYDFGTRNLFEGNGAVNATVTGADNISIGTSANSGLTTQSNTVAIGTNAAATGTDSITIGNGANTTAARTIVVGSRDSTSTGVAPTATATNAIAIGSAQGTNAGASAAGLSSIAFGGADGATFSGASASGNRSIAFGLNAISGGPATITVGSASGTAGGNGPRAVVSNGIAIGSANGIRAGAVAGLLLGNNIAIGGADGVFAGASATGGRAIALGVNPSAGLEACVLIGSASGTVGGTGPVTAERSTLAIGSAQGTQRATNAFNQTTIAIGGSDGVFPGAVALATRSISIGLNSTVTPSNATGSIAIGSASGTAGGLGATASGIPSVSIGSASGAVRGAFASTTNAVALGSSDGTSAGALATALRNVAIGTGATNALADAVVLGNAANTAVRVGIGIAAPTAKLDIVGADGTPVITLNQANVAIGNAPAILNRSSAAVAGTPIHYNASNQLFGFTSSQRYKTNIRSLGTKSEIIYQLNPVLYEPKQGYGEEKNIPGFIAEEVYAVAPDLVVLNNNKEPETIAYDYLHALAIQEIQKHAHQLQEHNLQLHDHQNLIANLVNEVMQLQERMQKLAD